MRGFLRARRAGLTLLILIFLVIVAALAYHSQYTFLGRGLGTAPLVQVMPVVDGAVIASATFALRPDAERLAQGRLVGPLVVWIIGMMAMLTAAHAAAIAVAVPSNDFMRLLLSLTRGVVGYTGVALVSGRYGGRTTCWILPLVLMSFALAFGYNERGMPFVWNTFAIGAWNGGSWALAWSVFALGLSARLLPPMRLRSIRGYRP